MLGKPIYLLVVAPQSLSVADRFRWLEDADSPATQQWIRKEQQKFEAHRSTWPARRWLHERIASWLHHDEWSVPRRYGTREFASQLPAGIDQPRLLCRDDPTGEPRVIFDLRLDAGPGASLNTWDPSPSGALSAVQVSYGGVEHGELVIRTVDDGRIVDGPIAGVRYSPIAWIDDGSFYYIRQTEHDGPGMFRRRGVWLHSVGSDPGDDVLVHAACSEEATVLDVAVHHRRWLVVSEGYGTGYRNDIWIADLSHTQPATPPLTAVQVGIDAETQVTVSREGHLYLTTTLNASRGRVCRTHFQQPSTDQWTTVIPEDDAAVLETIGVLHDETQLSEILVMRRRNGFSELTIHTPTGKCCRDVELPGAGYAHQLTVDEDGRRAHLIYAGVNQPPTVYAYHHGAPALTPAGFAPCPRPGPDIHRFDRTYRSADGTNIPIVVLSKGPVENDQPRPTLLHAYGSFGSARQFGFSATVLAWLELGGQYAVACVRGGGDLGRDWHHRGMGRQKPTTVADLLAAADWLVNEGYTSRAQLCLSGSSAGGLLMLAAITRRPQIAAGAIASAPLADMARYEQLGLGALWRAEFGNADDPDDLAVLLSYSPYHNTRSGEQYPAVVVTGFHDDTRTGAAHARKMTAALAAATTSDRPILLRYQMHLGHTRHPQRDLHGRAHIGPRAHRLDHRAGHAVIH